MMPPMASKLSKLPGKTYTSFSNNSEKTGFFKPKECKMSKNVTAMKNSCCRLFMVINILTSFQLPKLQNPDTNSRARPQQVKKNTPHQKDSKEKEKEGYKEQFTFSL